MFIIFGTEVIGITIEEGDFNCPVCKTIQPYELKGYRKYFTLFWIPIIPLKRQGKNLECKRCGSAFSDHLFAGDDDIK